MVQMDRRAFMVLASAMAVSPALGCEGLSPAISARLAAMREALAIFEVARTDLEAFRCECKRAGLVDQDAFWDWYQIQPVRVAYDTAGERACADVEAAFMTAPQTRSDEQAVMDALAAYEEIAPSAFAMQCAYDLFTPRRFQTYPHEPERAYLLGEADDVFSKSPMPDFLRRMRKQYRVC